jgi:hypothetical protein
LTIDRLPLRQTLNKENIQVSAQHFHNQSCTALRRQVENRTLWPENTSRHSFVARRRCGAHTKYNPIQTADVQVRENPPANFNKINLLLTIVNKIFHFYYLFRYDIFQNFISSFTSRCSSTGSSLIYLLELTSISLDRFRRPLA